MMRRFFILLMFIFTLSLFSCGGGSEVGQESTGSYCAAVKGLSICLTAANPEYLGTTDTPNYTSLVDAFPIADCDPSPDNVEPEPFTDHSMVLTLNIRALNPYADIPPQTGVVFESYTIDYRPSIDSIGAPPIERYQAYKTWVIPSPSSSAVSTEATMFLVFVDIPRKTIYRENILSGRYSSINATYINNYTATITLYGRTDTGTRFSIVTNTSFSIGPYNYCPA